MTLDEAERNLPLKIVSFDCLDLTHQARLSGLGIRVGVIITKLMPTPLQDPVECLVGTQLLTLEKQLLRSIKVTAS
jgi:Fe2+ transport system protein FeoA